MLLSFPHLAHNCISNCTDAHAISGFSLCMTCPIAANSADLSNASQLISVFFTMLWRLDGGFDLASRQWIEHGVSTVDWTCVSMVDLLLRLDGGLDMAS